MKSMERTPFAIPAAIPMVALLGAADAHLRIIEAAFPTLSITVRGNEITFLGDLEEGARLEALINELLVVIRSGQHLTSELVTRAISMFRQVPQDHPAVTAVAAFDLRPQIRNITWMRLMKTQLLLA
jgi:phosphate starvation-inducible PhoH-like protein